MKLENKILQTLTQQQKLSIKQQFDLKILEMNTQDIETYIEDEIESNPLLEFDEQYETSSIKFNNNNFDLMLNYVVQEKTLSEEICEQIDTYPKPIHKELAIFLAESLDGNGYLTLSDEELQESFPALSLDDIEDTISILQTFEPAGICARTLQECLLIQLCFEDIPYSQIAIMIVNFYLPMVAENKLPDIAKELDITIHDVQDAITLIRSLNPKPGSSYAQTSSYVNPDASIEVDDGEIKIHLFKETYGLHIQNNYIVPEQKEEKKFLQQKEKDAQQLLTSIEKRNSTLVRILEAIILHQAAFFLEHAQLKPLNMKDIAIKLDIHESTVSRTVSNKTLLFEQRTIPLKFFFPVKLNDETSANEVYLYLRKLIQEEDKRKPFSDQKLTDLLCVAGFQVSRRTIAKYRDQLKIPAAAKRKKFD